MRDRRLEQVLACGPCRRQWWSRTGRTEAFTFEEVDLEGPRADEVLVRVVATGLCHTDLTVPTMLPPEMFPNVFGHEGAGVVEAVGPDVSGIAPGDHVLMSLRSCRSCPSCAAGHVGYCESSLLLNYMGMRMDGSTTYSRGGAPVLGSFFGQSSFSQHAIAYADNCVVVDAALDLTRLAPYGCGFMAGAGSVLNVLDLGPADSLAVYGVGAVGLAAVAAAAGAGVGTIVAVDVLPSRLEAAGQYGAVGVDPSRWATPRWWTRSRRPPVGAPPEPSTARPCRPCSPVPPAPWRLGARWSCSGSALRSSPSTRST